MSFSGKICSWEFKNVSGIAPLANESKSVTEIIGKERKLSFHPHYIHEELIYLLNLELTCKMLEN